MNNATERTTRPDHNRTVSKPLVGGQGKKQTIILDTFEVDIFFFSLKLSKYLMPFICF